MIFDIFFYNCSVLFNWIILFWRIFLFYIYYFEFFYYFFVIFWSFYNFNYFFACILVVFVIFRDLLMIWWPLAPDGAVVKCTLHNLGVRSSTPDGTVFPWARKSRSTCSLCRKSLRLIQRLDSLQTFDYYHNFFSLFIIF